MVCEAAVSAIRRRIGMRLDSRSANCSSGVHRPRKLRDATDQCRMQLN